MAPRVVGLEAQPAVVVVEILQVQFSNTAVVMVVPVLPLLILRPAAAEVRLETT